MNTLREPFIRTYDDEDIRSIVDRYRKLYCIPRIEDANYKLFENKTRHFSVFPRNVGFLMNKIGHQEGFNDFVWKHTYSPIFRMFQTTYEYENVLDYLHKSDNRSKQFCTNSPILFEMIRYCPDCIAEDYHKIGDSYAHRIHQIDGIDYCMHHTVGLITNCCSCNTQIWNRRTGSILRGDNCSHCGHKYSESNKQLKKIELLPIDLLEDVNYIFSYKNELNIELLKEKNNYFSITHNYTSNGKLKDIYKFQEAIVSHYGVEQLKMIGVTFSQSKTYNFSKTSLRIQNKRLLPQLLIMRFFSGSAEMYLNNHTPIVRGPYFDSALQTEVKGKQKNIIRTEEWFNKLIQKYEETKSFSLTAKIMGCEPNTAEKYINLYIENNNSADVFLSILRVAKGHQQTRLEQIKETIREFMQSHPNNTRQDINKHIGRAGITFLKRHDQEWIDYNFPVHLSRREPNWAEVDNELLTKVNKVIKVIMENPPNRRISRSIIIRGLMIKEQKCIKNYADFLPRTVHAINDGIEDTDEYLIRKIPMIIKQIQGYGQKISLNLILSHKSYQQCSSLVIKEIEKEIQKLVL